MRRAVGGAVYGAGIRSAGLWAPLALLLALAAIRGWPPVDSAPPAWLERATTLAESSRTAGVALTDLLAPREDPRVGISLLLLRAGAPPGWLPVAARAVALATALATLFLLLRRSAGERATGVVSSLLLAASPIFLEGVLEASPALLLGLGFLAIARRAWPAWLQGVLVAWALGWSPWAWLTLLPLALGGALAGPRPRGGAWLAIGVGLGGLLLLSPPALMHPAGWVKGMLWEGALEGVGRGGLGFALTRGLWPLWGTLHVAGAALLLLRLPAWFARLRAGDASAPLFVGAVLLGAFSGFPKDAPLLLLLPWAAGEAASGGVALASRLGRGGRLRAPALCGLVAIAIAPLLATTLERAAGARGSAPRGAEVEAWLAERLAPGSLVAHDLGFAAPEGGALRYLAIPFHAIAPESERGAYWMGWYGGCRALVVSERMIVRFLERAEAFPDVLHFYEAARASAREERAFGDRPGSRLRALWWSDDRPLLAEGWRERVRRGPSGGLQGAFLARLGGEWVRGGEAGGAVDLLEAALAAGYDDVGIYLNLANAQLALERPLDAGRILDEALVRHPGTPEVLYNLGIVLTRVGYWDRAIEILTRLREQWPRSAQVAYLLGVALANQGVPGAAIALLEEALRLDPRLAQRDAATRLIERLREGEGS